MTKATYKRKTFNFGGFLIVSEVGGRRGGVRKGEKGWVWWHTRAFETSKPTPSDTPSLTRPHFLIFSIQVPFPGD